MGRGGGHGVAGSPGAGRRSLCLVAHDEQLAVLRILADRRRALAEDHTRMISQVHQLLPGLIPGGAQKSLPAAQAKALLATVRPRDAGAKPGGGWQPS
jgi:hypothetical protein